MRTARKINRKFRKADRQRLYCAFRQTNAECPLAVSRTGNAEMPLPYIMFYVMPDVELGGLRQPSKDVEKWKRE